MMFLRALISDQLFVFFLLRQSPQSKPTVVEGSKVWFSLWCFLEMSIYAAVAYYYLPTIRLKLIAAERHRIASRHSYIDWDTPRTGPGSINNCKTWIRASSEHAPTRPKLKVFSEMFSHHDMLMPFERLKFFLSLSFSTGRVKSELERERESERVSSAPRSNFQFNSNKRFLNWTFRISFDCGRRAVKLPRIPA